MEEENGLREDCILARPGSWPPTSCVHSSQKSGVWVGLFPPKVTILIYLWSHLI